MKLLVIIAAIPQQGNILSYAELIRQKTSAEVHVAAFIPTPGYIPVQENGVVLDNCTEFDLSEFEAQAKDVRAKYVYWPKKEEWTSFEVNIGDPLALLKHKQQVLQPDLILADTELMSRWEGLLFDSFGKAILEEIEVPFLSLKCNRDDAPLRYIGLLRNFDAPRREELGSLKDIQQSFGATWKLLGILKPGETP
ncbi:MAG: hypothetical protein AAGI38_20870, partial [Bacteroidota bacterium]